MRRKFGLRGSRASGSTRAKIARAFARGWVQGLPLRDFIRRPRRRKGGVT